MTKAIHNQSAVVQMIRTASATAKSLVLIVLLSLPATVLAAPITYQGQLQQEGEPFTGSVAMLFRLFDSPTDGTEISDSVFFSDVSVVDGLFQVELDFGTEAIDRSERWLEIEVDSGVLGPRQRLTPAPLAIRALQPFREVSVGLGFNQWGFNVGEASIIAFNSALRITKEEAGLGFLNGSFTLPLTYDGLTFELTGLEICHVATSDVVLQTIEVRIDANLVFSESVDATSAACEIVDIPEPIPMTLTAQPVVVLVLDWLTAGSDFVIFPSIMHLRLTDYDSQGASFPMELPSEPSPNTWQ